MQTLTTILAIAVLIVAAYGDIRQRRIPNELAIAVAILGLARMVIAREPVAGLLTLTAAAAVLFIGFLLFWRGFIGGGDAKLLAAVVLLAGYREVADLLLIMSFVGGFIALIVIAADWLGPWVQRIPIVISLSRAPARLALAADAQIDWMLQFIRPSAAYLTESHSLLTRPSVPYGVAIAAASVAVLLFQSSLPG